MSTYLNIKEFEVEDGELELTYIVNDCSYESYTAQTLIDPASGDTWDWTYVYVKGDEKETEILPMRLKDFTPEHTRIWELIERTLRTRANE